eukprot:TRINITY_DN2730_c0_g1_i1.p1 TRINITY_DN2730_c0_g1~~TRINITY_DN2730_c0_g1_i1.p1  ORF type:complete len:716 (+),score=129.23 TRINITY_DN2730_c0_g1_i1:51-2198(+)
MDLRRVTAAVWVPSLVLLLQQTLIETTSLAGDDVCPRGVANCVDTAQSKALLQSAQDMNRAELVLDSTVGVEDTLREVELAVAEVFLHGGTPNQVAAMAKAFKIMNDTLVETTLPAIRQGHVDDLDVLGNASKAAADCESGFKDDSRDVNSSQSIRDDNKRDHLLCRGIQKKLQAANASTWKALNEYLSGIKVPNCHLPNTPGDAMTKFFNDGALWFIQENATYMTKKLEYDAAHGALASKQATCNKEQADFESSYCLWQQRAEDVAKVHERCWTLAEDRYAKSKAVVLNSAEQRRTEFVVVKRLQCFLELLLSFRDRQGNKSKQMLDDCKFLRPDTSSLNITTPALPAKSTHDFGDHALKPGDANWSTREYYGTNATGLVVPVTACAKHTAMTTTTSTLSPTTTPKLTTTTMTTTSTPPPTTTQTEQVLTDPLEFTSCGQSGTKGPSTAQCLSSYSNTALAKQPLAVHHGIQSWTVPASGEYKIEAWGAQGGCQGGAGAYVSGFFNLTAGDVVHILVGQQGVTAPNRVGNGGGGGSFVVGAGNSPLVIAGGGGGSGHDCHRHSGSITKQMDGTAQSSGKSGSFGGASSGGSGGHGAAASYTTRSLPNGGGGGGFLGDGGSDKAARGGRSFKNGGVGGDTTGGFGGGGGSNNHVYHCGKSPHGGSGGGGYSGGGAGGGNCNGVGGGGGSYNSGKHQKGKDGVQKGDGKVVVTWQG